MKPIRIDQVVPSFGGRDAIGAHILHLRDLLHDLGFESDIWCKGAFPETRSIAKMTDDLPDHERPGTWWLYHLSSGSPVAELIAERPEPKMVDYHNITPASLFGGWVPWATEEAETGMRQLKTLTGASCFRVCRLGVQRAGPARSRDAARARRWSFRHFSIRPLWQRRWTATLLAARQRRARGWRRRLVVRRAGDPEQGPARPDQGARLLQAGLRPEARLHLVGTSMGDDYPRALERFARRIGLGDAVRLTGSVSPEALAAYYASSDVFVSASEHEGFCVPIVEAMSFGLPVVAFYAGAVPETAGLGRAGGAGQVAGRTRDGGAQGDCRQGSA